MMSSNSYMPGANQRPPPPSYSSTEMSADVDLSMANSACSGEQHSPSEGSSWASYVADFVATQHREATSSSSSSSLVVCQKLSSGKRKREDDTLEDTACSSSSPDKPPKARKRKETVRVSCNNIQSQVDAGFAKIKDVWINEVDGVVMKSPSDSGEQLTDLRKKGLCLVPMSMLVDFLQ